jgi:ring-1,2-phenylacetyl-CoA epoxidase subunit PaaE
MQPRFDDDMRQFHSLKVKSVDQETADSMRVTLQVPEKLKEQYDFLPGQHLPIQISVDGKMIRRTYSICSVPGEQPLVLGVRIQPGGLFSDFVANELTAGDELDVMPPFGQFHVDVDPESKKTYLAFAAGSGITPVMSIIRATLEGEPHGKFVLFYGNRRQSTTMFIDELYALKNRFPERFQLYFLFTREEQEYPIFSGRMDDAKVRELFTDFCAGLNPEEAFVCGPFPMIETITNALAELGLDSGKIHKERYGPPRKGKHAAERKASAAELKDLSTITVIMDGHRKSFDMPKEGDNIVDAAAVNGVELPFSCKGGVCATCRTHVREGEVQMETNYGLERWEVEKGYVLACQSHPISQSVVLDYDKA